MTPLDVCRTAARKIIYSHQSHPMNEVWITARGPDGHPARNIETVIWMLKARRYAEAKLLFETTSVAMTAMILSMTLKTQPINIGYMEGATYYSSLENLRDDLPKIRSRSRGIATVRVPNSKAREPRPDFETPFLRALSLTRSRHGQLHLLREMQS